MTYEDERDQGEIRRRAAWLLGMLAVVAALLVILMVFFLGGSGGGGDQDAGPAPTYPVGPGSSGSAQTDGASDTSTSPAASSSNPAADPTSSGPAPKASCPSQSRCTVQGDLAGAVSAINKLRAQHDLEPVQVDTSGAADTCALTSGDDCPQSFVWIHVDDLSGGAVVDGVRSFDGTDNLLDADATSFELGWAYDPGSHSSSCAIVRSG